MPELGLYDNRNRFMSPDLGRFLQPDPIGFKGDASNLYRYCGNDWANRTDPMGTDEIGEAVGGAIGAVVFGDIGVQIGAAAGAATGFGVGLETAGAGEVVTIPVGTIAGAVVGGGYGVNKGAEFGRTVGGKIGDWIKEKLNNVLHSRGGRTKSGEATESLEGKETAQDQAKKYRPQTKGKEADPDWEGFKRPKQNKIGNLKKAEQRAQSEDYNKQGEEKPSGPKSEEPKDESPKPKPPLPGQ
jgi:uncharacterized protein RhaS with RHS repeats